MTMQRTMRSMRSYLNDFDIDDILELIGLERKRTLVRYTAPMVGMFVLGALVGAGVGMFAAPRSGRSLRRQAERKIDDVREEVKERIRSVNTPSL